MMMFDVYLLCCICSDLIHKANDWLKKAPDVRVKTCETLTWMDKDERRLGDSELMLMTRRIADNVNTYHQRGLRSGFILYSIIPYYYYWNTCIAPLQFKTKKLDALYYLHTTIRNQNKLT